MASIVFLCLISAPAFAGDPQVEAPEQDPLISGAPEAEIGSIRVLGEALASRTAIIMEGAKKAIDLGYHVVNCSLPSRTGM